MDSDASISARDRWAMAFTARVHELAPDAEMAHVVLACTELFAEVGEMNPVEVAENYAAACLPKEKRLAR